MAGVGEASAIVGIAQLGFSLAKTLNTLIGDYKDARQTLTRMGAEIESTSLAMERLGDLAKKGRLYGSKGVLEAAGLANRYSEAIIEIRVMLKKKNKPMDPNIVTSDEIELSCFEKIRFAFLKPRLEISQLEVSRIKADLTLTYLSLIALTGDTDAEKKQALSEIPSWTRTLKWANREFEKAVARQHNSITDPQPLIGLQTLPPPYAVPSHGPGTRYSRHRQNSVVQEDARHARHTQSNVIQDDVSAEHLKQYIQWAENKHVEAQRKAEELRLQALQLEKMKKQEEEAAREQVIAEKAIKQYEEKKRLEAAELAYKQEERDHDLRQRLQAANVEEEEIDRIMSKAPLMLTAPGQDAGVGVSSANGGPRNQVALISQKTAGHNSDQLQRQQAQGMQNHTNRYSQPFSTPSRPKPAQNPKKSLERPLLEAWCIDQGSQSRFCTPLAEDWLDEFIASKTYKKSSQLMWERYAQLHLWYRKQINDVFEEKQRDGKHKWSMISLHQSKKARSPFLLRRPSKDSLVQMILVRMPLHSDQKYKTWLDDGEDGGSILPILPSAPLPNQGRTGVELYVDGNADNEIQDPETTQSTSDQADRSDINSTRRDPSQKHATIVVEVFELENGYSTILPIDKVDSSSLLDAGYDYIETGTDYVIQQLVKSSELDALIDQKYQSIAVIVYEEDFQMMQAAERSSVRRYIKQQNFPSSNLLRNSFLFFRFVKTNEIGLNGLCGNFVREHPEVESASDNKAQHLPSRKEIQSSRHASLSRPKETRFDIEHSRPYILPYTRDRDDSLDDYQPVRVRSPVHDHRYSQPNRKTVIPPRFTPAMYGAPHTREPTITIRDPTRFDDYAARKDWTVVPGADLLRQDSHRRRHGEPATLTLAYGNEERPRRHMAAPGPLRRGSYDFEDDPRSRYPQIHDTAISHPFAPVESRSRARGGENARRPGDPFLRYADAGPSRRRSRYRDRRGSLSDDSYGELPTPWNNKDSRYYETRERDGYEARATRSRIPPLEDDDYRNATSHPSVYRREQRSVSPIYRDQEYVSSRPPRPYGFPGAEMEDVDDGEQEFQTDKDITAMQLAKITGGMPSTFETTTDYTATKSTENQKRRSSDYVAETVGPFRARSTYVEDTIDDDDIANKPIEDRIYEIDEEPEPLFVEVVEETTKHQQTAEPPKASEASAWSFGPDGKNDNHNTPAAPHEEKKDHSQWGWPSTAKDKPGEDDGWGAWGTTSKDKKKKKKKKGTTATTSANTGKWAGEDDWGEATATNGSSRRGERAKAEESTKGKSNAKKDTADEEPERERRSRSEESTGRATANAVVRRRRRSGSTDDEKNWSWASDHKDHYDDWDKRKNAGRDYTRYTSE